MRYPSVLSGKVRQLPNGKGATAEAVKRCLSFYSWVGREYLPDCHKVFVKRYQWLSGGSNTTVVTVFSMEPLDKAVHFFRSFPSDRE